MRIKISEDASQDLINGYNFYEEQEPGVGEYFLDSLFSSIDSLVLYYGIQQKFFGKYFRMLSRTFPYAIYYSHDEEIIYIHSVLDVRQNPTFIKHRLED